MKQDVVKAWVNDLRENADKQGSGSLKTADGGYCCIGRLAVVLRDRFPDVIQEHKIIVEERETSMFVGLEGNKSIFNFRPDMIDLVGLTTTIQDDAVHLNDNGCSFSEIADWLESLQVEMQLFD